MRKALYIKQEYFKQKSETEYITNKYKAKIHTLNKRYIEITPREEDYFYKYEIDANFANTNNSNLFDDISLSDPYNPRKPKYKKRGREKHISLEKTKEINKIIKEILFPKEDMEIKEIEIINDALRILIE